MAQIVSPPSQRRRHHLLGEVEAERHLGERDLFVSGVAREPTLKKQMRTARREGLRSRTPPLGHARSRSVT